jgi:hypothetical protein
MADDTDKEPPPSSQQRGQQMTEWVPGEWWSPPPIRRNPLLYTSQDQSFDMSPPQPPDAAPDTDARAEDIEARFQDVLRRSADLTAAIDLLRAAIPSPAGRVVGPGHNQGPPLPFEELDDETQHLLALLKEKGPTPAPADRALIVERADRTMRLSQRITAWLTNLGAEAAKLGAREVAKDLTAPLWQNAADRIIDLCHAIKDWLLS